ncbi:hypothetical protein AUC68_01370 [Methyloceanibacter methanicus]|uniref:Uncharacterized protein n=1 Tax=Methyloceanibacter methanicus TaxID=1774968 RepID=A0A1E3W2T9_9HYPH|nr:hypothetical protein [Methyloceanibacter methanicus]ODR99821.1 hypothetical protein AUC68_01370 [Methyloceanibacter methanicus]
MRLLRFVPVWMLLVSVQAVAYDGFDADFSTCTQGNDSGAVVAACSRLIDNAAAENAITGMFYGLRAANGSDAAQNCADAKKSLALADDAAIKTLSQQLIDSNC